MNSNIINTQKKQFLRGKNKKKLGPQCYRFINNILRLTVKRYKPSLAGTFFVWVIQGTIAYTHQKLTSLPTLRTFISVGRSVVPQNFLQGRKSHIHAPIITLFFVKFLISIHNTSTPIKSDRDSLIPKRLINLALWAGLDVL